MLAQVAETNTSRQSTAPRYQHMCWYRGTNTCANAKLNPCFPFAEGTSGFWQVFKILLQFPVALPPLQPPPAAAPPPRGSGCPRPPPSPPRR